MLRKCGRRLQAPQGFETESCLSNDPPRTDLRKHQAKPSASSLIPYLVFESLFWIFLAAGNKARQFAGPLYIGYSNPKGTTCQDRFCKFPLLKQKELRDLGRGVLTNPEAHVTQRRCVSEPRRPSPECTRPPAGSAAGSARVDGSLPRRRRRSIRSHSLKSLPSAHPGGPVLRLPPGQLCRG